jgi:hypothetical protein
MLVSTGTSVNALVRRYYDCFNERRLDEAASLFAADAVLEHAPFGPPLRGAEGYLEFARQWIEAFPDARLLVDRLERRGDTICEVDLRADGTHLGTLAMGVYRFKPTRAKTSLGMRQLLEIRDGRITFSSISFPPQDFLRQLVSVDHGILTVHLNQIGRLSAALVSAADTIQQREIVEHLGVELDAARNVLRPYFLKERASGAPSGVREPTPSAAPARATWIRAPKRRKRRKVVADR